MKTVSVSDLRNHFDEVERLLRKGKSVRVTKRGKIVARLVPELGTAGHGRPPLPDFQGRLKEIYGDEEFEVSGA